MAKEEEVFVSEILEILKTRHSLTNLSAWINDPVLQKL